MAVKSPTFTKKKNAQIGQVYLAVKSEVSYQLLSGIQNIQNNAAPAPSFSDFGMESYGRFWWVFPKIGVPPNYPF